VSPEQLRPSLLEITFLAARALSDCSQGATIWVLHHPQVGGVNLCVSVKTAEILVDSGSVEKNCQTVGESFRQAVLVFMKDIQMVSNPRKSTAGNLSGLTTLAIMRRCSSFDENRRTTV